MRVLIATPTTNQMYSGIGRAIFELARRLRNRVAFTFALDDRDPSRIRRVWEFTSNHDMPLCIGPHRFDSDCVDPVNEDLPSVIGQGDWDVIELIGFANAATGRTVLNEIDDRTALCYTPHDQPLWTVPMTEAQQSTVAEVHRRVLERADIVLADSPVERRQLQRLVPGRLNGMDLPLGCDFETFTPGPADRPPQLLFVGDLAEVRKRFDRVVTAFERVLARWPEYRLVVIGNRSDEALDRIPSAIRHAVELRGYVSEPELRSAYAGSRALLLFSDVEAFGLPILEALACGTPVFLGRLETTESLFGSCAGAHFVPIEDLDALGSRVERSLDQWKNLVSAALADRARLRASFDWSLLADRKWNALKAAWYQRNAWAWTA